MPLIIISGGGGGGGGVGVIEDGNYGAFTVTGGLAELNSGSVVADNIANGELPPEKLVGYTAVTGNDGDVFQKTAGAWSAVDTKPVIYGFIPGAIPNATYNLILKLRRAALVSRLVSKLASGTCTLAVRLDGVNVGGISAVSATSTELVSTASSANSAVVDVTVSLVVSAGSSPVDLTFQIDFDYE